ncbi:MAG: hypothetical protein K8S87_06965 [Planctomycetes bacterium]|nr:hypothetical protein [Planctomycetota bacterium]
MQSHGDLDYKEEIILHTDGDNPQQTLDDISSLTFKGDGDPHESHLDGIENLLKIVPWANNPANSTSAMLVLQNLRNQASQRRNWVLKSLKRA